MTCFPRQNRCHHHQDAPIAVGTIPATYSLAADFVDESDFSDDELLAVEESDAFDSDAFFSAEAPFL